MLERGAEDTPRMRVFIDYILKKDQAYLFVYHFENYFHDKIFQYV